jgi:serine/threonine protein kinase
MPLLLQDGSYLLDKTITLCISINAIYALDRLVTRFASKGSRMEDRLERIGRVVGDYRLMRWLGGGGFGNVYLAEHVHNGGQVALKVLEIRLTRSEDLRTFLNEARVMRLHHPHIIPVLDFGLSWENMPFLVIEYASQGTLRDQHPKGSRILLPAVITYATQVASALQYAHSQRIIHRDVKPENMLVRADGTILLSDFGIVTTAHSTHSLSANQDIIGTIPYMAPEQLEGRPRTESDQYALGIVIYEWLAGRCPFQGTAVEVAIQHTLKQPPSLVEQVPDVSPRVEEVLFKSLAKNPKDRFISIYAFLHALQEASNFFPVPDKTSGESFPKEVLSLTSLPTAGTGKPGGPATIANRDMLPSGDVGTPSAKRQQPDDKTIPPVTCSGATPEISPAEQMRGELLSRKPLETRLTRDPGVFPALAVSNTPEHPDSTANSAEISTRSDLSHTSVTMDGKSPQQFSQRAENRWTPGDFPQPGPRGHPLSASNAQTPILRRPSISVPGTTSSSHAGQRGTRALSRVSGSIFLLLVAIGVLFYFVPGAVVTISLQAWIYSNSVRLNATATAQANLPNSVLAQVLKHDFSVSGSGTASGTTRVGNARARGLVDFINNTAQRIIVPSGTIVVTQSGIQFATDAEVAIDRDSSYPAVPVTALQEGEISNVAAGSITVIPPASLARLAEYNHTSVSAINLVVANIRPTSGGGAADVPAVTVQDMQALTRTLHMQLQVAVGSWLADQVQSGDVHGTPIPDVLDSTEPLPQEQLLGAPDAGQAASDGIFPGTLALSVRVLIARAANVRAAAGAQLNAAALNLRPAETLARQFPVTLAHVQSTSSRDGSTLAITAIATGAIIVQVSLHDIANSLVGKGMSQIASDLNRSLPSARIQNVQVNIPFSFPGLMPWRADRIQIILRPVQQPSGQLVKEHNGYSAYTVAWHVRQDPHSSVVAQPCIIYYHSWI